MFYLRRIAAFWHRTPKLSPSQHQKATPNQNLSKEFTQATARLRLGALELVVAGCAEADLPGRGGNEHRLVEEERTPFLGVGPVGIVAAEQLELPVEAFHEPGIAKQGDQVAFAPEEPTDWIYFHGPSLAGGVGHIRG